MNQGKSSSRVDEDGRFRRYYARYLEPLEQHFESLLRDAVKERNRRASSLRWRRGWRLWVASATWLIPLGSFGRL